MFRFCILLVVILAGAGCNKSKQNATVAITPVQKPGSQTEVAQPRVPPCALIAKEEVGAIQHATITEAKSSTGVSGTMLMSQCYYNAREPNLSVSVALIEHNPQDASAPDAKTFWVDTFHRATGEAHGEEKEGGTAQGRDGEEKEKAVPPKKVEGIGEEAYWSGNRFGGALYVLSKDAIIRVSIGGPDNEQTKVEKSKALAQKALGRL